MSYKLEYRTNEILENQSSMVDWLDKIQEDIDKIQKDINKINNRDIHAKRVSVPRKIVSVREMRDRNLIVNYDDGVNELVYSGDILAWQPKPLMIPKA